MRKKMRIYSIFMATLILIMSISTPVFASSTEAFDNAKRYLQNYFVTKVNEMGKEYTIRYTFETEQDLEKVASYIARYGIENFNKTVDEGLAKVVAKEPYNVIRPRATTPTVAYATVSGNGIHSVSDVAYGYITFNEIGAMEYGVELGYQVHVNNGRMTGVSGIYLNVFNLASYGSWEMGSCPSYCNATNAGVTANYTVTKEIRVPIDGVSIGIKAESSNEIFSLLTNLA